MSSSVIATWTLTAALTVDGSENGENTMTGTTILSGSQVTITSAFKLPPERPAMTLSTSANTIFNPVLIAATTPLEESSVTPVAAPSTGWSTTTIISLSTVEDIFLITSQFSGEAPLATPTTAPLTTTSIPPGVLAGVGIACAAVGATLASLVLCFLLIRWRPDHSPRSSSARPFISENMRVLRAQRFGFLGRRGCTDIACAVEASLPSPVPDSQILAAFLRLWEGISNHARDYFTAGPVAEPRNVDELYLDKLLRRGALIKTLGMKRLLLDRRTRLSAVQFLLAWSILQHVQGGDTWKSLLPPEVAESQESISGPGDRSRVGAVGAKAHSSWH